MKQLKREKQAMARNLSNSSYVRKAEVNVLATGKTG